MNDNPRIINKRPRDCRKKWFRVFCTWVNGKTEEVARFTHAGDVELYCQQILNPCSGTVEKIVIY